MEILAIIFVAGIVIGFFFGCRCERRNNDRILQSLKDSYVLELNNMRKKIDAESSGL